LYSSTTFLLSNIELLLIFLVIMLLLIKEENVMYKNHTILNRNRVYYELENLLDYPLAIITAPMGYGKSTGEIYGRQRIFA